MTVALSALARQASAALPFLPSRLPSSPLPPDGLSRPDARTRVTLHALLDRCAALGPDLPNGYTNHLPMALHALAGLGADADRLETFARRYLARQGLVWADGADAPPPLPTPPRVLPGWQRLRGLADAHGTLREAMAQGLALHGTGPWVRGVLPALWPGLGAAALHGPIRVAHALQAGHAGELASALAFWASRWRPLPEVAAADPLPRLVPLAVQGYAMTGDFTVLHLVTGLRAVRVLLPWLPPQADAGVLWRVVVAGWLAAPLHRVAAHPLPAPDTLPGWPALRAAACAQDDDHVIKLVHACQDHAAQGLAAGGACRQAAARALARPAG